MARLTSEPTVRLGQSGAGARGLSPTTTARTCSHGNGGLADTPHGESTSYNQRVVSSPTRRRRSSNQPRVMDRAWGAVIGLILLVFIGGSVLLGQISGANAGGCDKSLAPLPGARRTPPRP